MIVSSEERRIRASLPIIRFLQAHMPIRLACRLIRYGLAHTRLPAGAAREAVSADGVPCEWIIPRDRPTDRVLLYLHGGGFVFGLTPQHLQMGAYLAHGLGFRILMPEYRLAPGHPYPAALDDCVGAYRWLLKEGISAEHIGIAGDSAGGNLTVAMMMKLRESGDALPAAAACLSPAADLTIRARRRAGFQDPLLPPKAVKFYTQSYVGGRDPRDPLISPVFGDLRGLPPLLVHVGEEEILREDAVRLAQAAESAGVDVRLEVYPRMWHVWQLNLTLPQAVQSLDDIAVFFKEHLR
jgi:acetyl esterase/lipase